MATHPEDLIRANEARRDELLVEAEQVLTRQAGADLVGEDATRFTAIGDEIRACEARIAAARELADREQAVYGHPMTSKLLGAMGGGPVAEGPSRIPSAMVTREQIVEAHAAVMAGQAARVLTRAVTVDQLEPADDTLLPPVGWGREPTRILSLMPGRQVGTPSVRYYRQTAAADAAAPVAEGQLKPESEPGWEPVDVPITKVAHYVDISKEALDDVDSFQQVVGTELLRGLSVTESTQAISGDGTPPAMRGILHVAGVDTYAPASPEAEYLSILGAITKLRTGAAYATADTVLMHPNDYQAVVSTATQAGELVVTRDPTGATPTRLWGVPVVQSTGVPPGLAIVADLAGSCLAFWREPPSITVDPYSQSSLNLVRFICEERVALAVTRPAGVCKVTFDTE